MINVATALYEFFSGFGIPAYEENSVPDTATYPYITYRLIQPEWHEAGSLYANVWYRGSSLSPLLAKVDQISNAIGEGKSIKTPDGVIYLHKDMLFFQMLTQENDEMVKCGYLSLVINAFTA